MALAAFALLTDTQRPLRIGVSRANGRPRPPAAARSGALRIG